jgi:hypothetical protein
VSKLCLCASWQVLCARAELPVDAPKVWLACGCSSWLACEIARVASRDGKLPDESCFDERGFPWWQCQLVFRVCLLSRFGGVQEAGLCPSGAPVSLPVPDTLLASDEWFYSGWRDISADPRTAEEGMICKYQQWFATQGAPLLTLLHFCRRAGGRTARLMFATLQALSGTGCVR